MNEELIEQVKESIRKLTVVTGMLLLMHPEKIPEIIKEIKDKKPQYSFNKGFPLSELLSAEQMQEASEYAINLWREAQFPEQLIEIYCHNLDLNYIPEQRQLH